MSKLIPGKTGTHLVTEILDGDTFATDDKSIVRLFSVSAPEAGRCGSQEAKKALTEVALNRRVRLDTKVRDEHGRQIAMVYDGNKIINAEVLKTGWFTFSGGQTDDRDLLKSSYQEAKNAKIGIYSEKCTQLVNPDNSKCSVKGNISVNEPGKKFYHFPGCSRYEDVFVDLYRGDQWFCTEAEARAAGFTKSSQCFEKKFEKKI